MLRKKDGSKYSDNSIKAIKSALVTNKLFEQKENKFNNHSNLFIFSS